MATKTRVTMDALTYAERFNAVVGGMASFDETSDGSKLEPKMDIAFGTIVPATRRGIAAYNGMSYNASLAREKAYRKSGVNLSELPKGKRGKSINVDAINEALAESVVASSM